MYVHIIFVSSHICLTQSTHRWQEMRKGLWGVFQEKEARTQMAWREKGGEIEHEELNWLKMGDVLVRYLST